MQPCFMQDFSWFYSEVKDETGEIVATIRSLTPADEDLIKRKANFRIEETPQGPHAFFDTGAYENYHLLLSLGGKVQGKSFQYGEEGIRGMQHLDEEKVNLLSPKLRTLILNEILLLKKRWQDEKDGILKNLPLPLS